MIQINQMMKIRKFLSINQKTLIGFLLGFFVGLIYWGLDGCYWGIYHYSAEWWMNTIIGGIIGGFIGCIIDKKY